MFQKLKNIQNKAVCIGGGGGGCYTTVRPLTVFQYSRSVFQTQPILLQNEKTMHV